MIKELYPIIEDNYFSTENFYGTPIYILKGTFKIQSKEFISSLRKAIIDEVLTARFYGEPHIKSFSSPPKDKILKLFDAAEYPGQICLFPHETKLFRSKRLTKYRKTPYKLELARGAGLLDYRTFEISVLKHYLNDPRYLCSTDITNGKIRIFENPEYINSSPDHDQLLIQTFGYAYDNNQNKYITVFLKYLSKLSSEHQYIWSEKEIK
jgi:hypothetical protein